MTSVLQKLDDAPRWKDPGWYLQIKESLTQQPDQWLSAVQGTEKLSDERAWVLLSWIEQAATALVRESSQSTLETAAFARSLLTRSLIDRRDIALVEALLRRGAQLADVSFVEAVTAGCSRAGEFGRAAHTSLMEAATTTPETHAEEGAAGSFAFRRRPAGFDVNDLEKWLEGDGTD